MFIGLCIVIWNLKLGSVIRNIIIHTNRMFVDITPAWRINGMDYIGLHFYLWKILSFKVEN